jgi:hypothetical protein
MTMSISNRRGKWGDKVKKSVLLAFVPLICHSNAAGNQEAKMAV